MDYGISKAEITNKLSRLACIGLIGFNCSACGLAQLQTNFKSEERVDGKVYGSVKLAPGMEEDAPSLDVYKVHKGYALKGNLDWDEETGRKGDVVLMRNREFDWFAGLQWRFEF